MKHSDRNGANDLADQRRSQWGSTRFEKRLKMVSR